MIHTKSDTKKCIDTDVFCVMKGILIFVVFTSPFMYCWSQSMHVYHLQQLQVRQIVNYTLAYHDCDFWNQSTRSVPNCELTHGMVHPLLVSATPRSGTVVTRHENRLLRWQFKEHISANTFHSVIYQRYREIFKESRPIPCVEKVLYGLLSTILVS